MIEEERKGLRGDPDREAKTWLDKLTEVDEMRADYQELAAKKLMSFEELSTKLAGIEDARRIAVQELDALKDRRARLPELERDTTALLETFSGMAPSYIDDLTPEERNRVYKMLRLRCVLRPNAPVELSGSVMVGPEVRDTEIGRWSRFTEHNLGSENASCGSLLPSLRWGNWEAAVLGVEP